ncbi:uncharacterized protein [Solanum lycopersicum]|uniref:uncharacterized protein n=1 Tax=Solanum lycopersicum TaxID=4081 RepID=UPI0002BCA27B|nr:uncharacterized protein LOC101244363 [Solanum lycopersicum]
MDVLNVPEVQTQGEVTDAEFCEAIQMLKQAVTKQVRKQRGSQEEKSNTSRFFEFLRMNPRRFFGSSTTEDPKKFVEELKKESEVQKEYRNKKTKIRIESGQHKGGSNRQQFQKHNGNAPSSASALVPKNRGEYNGQNSQNYKAMPAQSQGSMAQGSSWAPTYAKCGRTHKGKYHDVQTCCFKCGQEAHFMREFPKNKQGGGNLDNKAQYSSLAPLDRVAPRGATSSTCEGQTVSM